MESTGHDKGQRVKDSRVCLVARRVKDTDTDWLPPRPTPSPPTNFWTRVNQSTIVPELRMDDTESQSDPILQCSSKMEAITLGGEQLNVPACLLEDVW